MSLNGLDEAAIAMAVQGLRRNPSGWLLLRYATRDEVELYGSGTLGVGEARAKIVAYEEKSPLYGVVADKGTKVLLKYVPEGTSRLLQARVKVHFETLEEFFAHNAQLSITTPEELTSEALAYAAGAPMPTSAPALSPEPVQTPLTSPSPPSIVQSTAPKEEPGTQEPALKVDLPQDEGKSNNPGSRTAQLLADVRAGKLESHEVLAALKISSTLDELPAPPALNTFERPERTSSLNAMKKDLEPEPEPELASPSSDILGQFPSPRVSTSSDLYVYKPKTKLGPRPVLSPETIAAGVASLPAGISVPTRTPQSPGFPSPQRPTSSHTAHIPFRFGESGTFPLVQSPGSVMTANNVERERPKSRAGSVVTLPAGYGSSVGKNAKHTKEASQEKLRLMKALELRRKQQAKERALQGASSAEHPPRTDSMAPPTGQNSVAQAEANGLKEQQAVEGTGVDENPKEVTESKASEPQANGTSGAVAEEEEPVSKKNNAGKRESGERARSSFIHIPESVPEEAQLNPTAQHLPLSAQSKDAPNQETSGALAAAADGSKLSQEAEVEGTAPVSKAIPDSTVNNPQAVATSNLSGEKTDSADVTPVATQAQEAFASEEETKEAPTPARSGFPRLHTKEISISTSLSGASFLEELDESTVHEAQPVTFVKSPITPAYSKPFETAVEQGTETTESAAKAATEQETEKIEKAEATAPDAGQSRDVIPTQSAVTSPSAASEDRAVPFDDKESNFEGSPPSASKGDIAKKHPTVNPPHIWGGPLRAASNPTTGPPRHLSPAPDLQKLNRSTSIASNNSSMLRPDSPSGVKKPGVGSRIADRIKALEKSSGSGPTGSSTYITPGTVNVSSRKSSFNTPPGSSGADAIRKPPYPTPSPSPGTNIFSRRFNALRSGPASESGRTDNTVRPTQLRDGLSNQSSGNVSSTELQRPTARPTYIRQTSSDSRTSVDSKKMESVPPSREGAQGPGQARGSFGSRHRPSFSGIREGAEPPRVSGHSRQSSVESTGTNSEKKKENKAKKLMKRVSGAFSPRKDRHVGNTGFGSEPIMEGVEQEAPVIGKPRAAEPFAKTASRSETKPQSKWNSSVVIGEVNIQFPDTLLWKRRHMELDGEGFVVLLPSASDRSSRIASKKYHMSEFYPPYIPDQEREELPYSVILDFMDSSTLQCACQNTTDQLNVLHALTTVHSAFAQRGR